MSTSPVVRIVVVSRRRLIRDAVRTLLAQSSWGTLVGQADRVAALPELCRLRRPDAALVDTDELTMPVVRALRRARAATGTTELVLTCAVAAPSTVATARRAGITVLTPAASEADLLEAVRRRARPGRLRADGISLTDADLQVVSLLSSGHSVPEIAGRLQLSPYTVENRKRRLYVKLDVGTSSHAVSRATSLGLVDPSPVPAPVRPEEPGRPPLAVVHGVPGPSLDAVLLALVAAQLPFVYLRSGHSPQCAQEHWARWHRGPILVVLVDPAPDDWRLPAGLGAHSVVVRSREADPTAVADTLARGGRALIRARDVPRHLAPVLSVVSCGYLAVDASQQHALPRWIGSLPAGNGAGPPRLTTRERQILIEISRGSNVPQAARTLGVAAKTVENTLARLYRKLGVRNRAGALTVAHQLGLLDRAPGGPPPH